MKTRGEFRRLQTKGMGHARAFSLIELLSVIAIIGIIAAVMIPMISGLNDSTSRLAKDRRNAQNLCSVFLSAQVAGVDFLAPGSVEDTIDNIVAGGAPSKGVFAGETFIVPGLSETDKAGAAVYLRVENGMLVYDYDPSS